MSDGGAVVPWQFQQKTRWRRRMAYDDCGEGSDKWDMTSKETDRILKEAEGAREKSSNIGASKKAVTKGGRRRRGREFPSSHNFCCREVVST
jgi:hypothetical protein